MSHSVALAYRLTDLKPERVSTLTSSPTCAVDTYDAFSVRFTSGAIGSFSGAGEIPENQQFQLEVRIFGSKGVLSIDCDSARLEILRHDGNNTNLNLEPTAGAYNGVGPTNNFAYVVISKNTTNWATGWASMRAVEIMDAADRSMKSGSTESV